MRGTGERSPALQGKLVPALEKLERNTNYIMQIVRNTNNGT